MKTISLFRLLWAGILTLTLLVFSISFLTNLYMARSYLEQQLYAQSNDNASALALSLSQQAKDNAIIELQISALFDSGHFQLVRYHDLSGRTIIERSNTIQAGNAPEWFAKLIPIEIKPARAQVSDGWKQAGEVTVIAHSRFAYQSLWQGSLRLLVWMTLAGLAAGLIASRFLRWLRKPIGGMVEQANAITERRFLTLPEPRITELGKVTRAMNSMVERVRAMFDEQAERIAQLRSDANRDALTGLANRSFFNGRLQQALNEEDAPPAGALFIVRLNDLSGLNRRQGREAADLLLQEAARQLASQAEAYPEALAARLNGADFALLAPALAEDEAASVATRLIDSFGNLHRRGLTDDPRAAVCGWTLYRQAEAASSVLARCDNALVSAESAPCALARDCASSTSQQPNSDWHALLTEALAGNRFELAEFPVLRLDGQLLHEEVVLRLRDPASGALLPAGVFMPYAQRLGLMPQLDLKTVELALARGQAEVAVNLAAESIRDADFCAALEKLLTKSTCTLWLEVNELGLRNEMAALAQFAHRFSRFGCKVGIEHFGRHFGSIPQLYELQLDYLKIDGSFVHDLNAHAGNRHLLKAIAGIAANLGMLAIAEQVNSDAEWVALQATGITGATGPEATRRKPG